MSLKDLFLTDLVVLIGNPCSGKTQLMEVLGEDRIPFRFDPLCLNNRNRNYRRLLYNGTSMIDCLEKYCCADREIMNKIERIFCSIFPYVKSIVLTKKDSEEENRIYIQDHQKALHCLSDSQAVILMLLTVLNYSWIEKSIICIDNIENYLHPKMLQALHDIIIDEVINNNKNKIKLFMSTNSPYFINTFKDNLEFVYYLHKFARYDSDKIDFTPLTQYKDIIASSNDLTLGEIWFSGLLDRREDGPNRTDQ